MKEKRYSSHFQCPHEKCRRVIEKPASYQIFAGARGVGMASTAHDSCPYCRGSINRLEILDGTYDYRPSGTGATLFGNGVLIAVILLAARFG